MKTNCINGFAIAKYEEENEWKDVLSKVLLQSAIKTGTNFGITPDTGCLLFEGAEMENGTTAVVLLVCGPNFEVDDVIAFCNTILTDQKNTYRMKENISKWTEAKRIELCFGMAHVISSLYGKPVNATQTKEGKWILDEKLVVGGINFLCV